MSILSIDHVQLGFASGHWSLMRHFYTHLLGLRELHEASPGRTLRLAAGAQRIDLVPADDWRRPPAPAHLALSVRDLPRVRDRLKVAGWVLDESRPQPGHLRYYLHDPAGNALELLEPARARPVS